MAKAVQNDEEMVKNLNLKLPRMQLKRFLTQSLTTIIIPILATTSPLQSLRN